MPDSDGRASSPVPGPTDDRAPDLVRGRITNGIEAANCWTTRIQSVLVERSGDGDREYHLSQECRRENVPFSSGELGGGEEIFKTDTPYEFLTFSEGGHFHQLITSDGTVGGQVLEMFRHTRVGDIILFHPVSDPDWTSRVSCDWRPIRALSFDDLLGGLQDGTANPNDLFLRFSWRQEERGFEVFMPCPYLNFAHPRKNENAYVQPITGPILFKFQDLYVAAYFACAVDRDGRQIAEVAVPAFTDTFELLRSRSKPPKEVAGLLRNLAPLVRSLSPFFGTTFQLEGEVLFYAYADEA